MQNSFSNQKLVICMVGLPARGKTYISRKIARYLNWLGYTASVFNIANFRKSVVGVMPLQYLDPTNKEANEKRQNYHNECLDALIDYLTNGGHAAIFDGSNTTKKRRLELKQTIEKKVPGAYLMWIESICNEEEVIENNIRQAKIKNTDYEEFNEEEAAYMFKEKLKKLSSFYEPLNENEYNDISYVKLTNVGKEVEIHNIDGYLQSKILSYIMNLQIYPRPIYFSRHGESIYNTANRIGGDSDLTEKGRKYCKVLNDFFVNEIKSKEFILSETKPKILTSTLIRAVNTAKSIDIGVKPICLKILDEINTGLYDGLSYEEMEEKFPQDFFERTEDKLRYRFPRGESYLDLIQRIEPVIFEIERSKGPVIVVSHQATLRCLYSYFTHDCAIPEIPFISMPHNTIIKLIPETYYCKEYRYLCNIETGEIIQEKQENTATLIKKRGGYDFF